jgi:hypothetical protein
MFNRLRRLPMVAVAGLVLTLAPAPAVAQEVARGTGPTLPSTLPPATLGSGGLSGGASCVDVRANPTAYAKASPYATCDESANAKGVTARHVVDQLVRGSTSVVPVPDYCGTTPLGSWAIHPEDRTKICRVDMRELYVIRVNDGALVGYLTYGVVSYSYTSSSTLQWGHQIQIGALSAAGDVAGIRAQGSLTCSGSCFTRSLSFPSQSVLSGLATGEAGFVSTLFTGAATATTTATFHFTKPGALDSNTVSIEVPRVRCDDLPGNPGAGCVFVDGRPVMVYNYFGPYSELAVHIYDAQQSGLPGDYFRGSALTRTTNAFIMTANGDTACPDRYVRPSGRSCDEYPFASTNQGAWVMKQSGGTARTFTYCSVPEPTGVVGPTGWSACMINELHNSGGGGALSAFYLRNRVVDNDVFHVAILG